jgi:hypothetical protein
MREKIHPRLPIIGTPEFAADKSSPLSAATQLWIELCQTSALEWWESEQQRLRELVDQFIERRLLLESERYRVQIPQHIRPQSYTRFPKEETSSVRQLSDEFARLYVTLSYAEQRRFIEHFGTVVKSDKPDSNLHRPERLNRIHCAGAIPSAGETSELWVRFRHFELSDEPRRFGFFQGLPLINWIIDSVEAERSILKVEAKRQYLNHVACETDVTPLPDYHLRQFATAHEWAAVKRLNLTADEKIEFIKQQRRAEYTHQTVERATKEELTKWNDILLVVYDLPEEPRGIDKLKFKHLRKSVPDFEITDEERESRETATRLSRTQEPNDDADEPVSSIHATFGTNWIDNSHQKQNDEPIDPTELRKQFKIFFNPDNYSWSPEVEAFIRNHPKFAEYAYQYYVLMTGAQLTDSSDAKPNTIIQQFKRGSGEREKIASLYEQGYDPEFKQAHDRWWAQLPCIEINGTPIKAVPKFPIHGGWFVAVTLNNRPMLYRLDCPCSWFAASIPNEAERAFERLHQDILKEAVRQAEQQTKGLSRSTVTRAARAARKRIDAAFERVTKLYLMPTFDTIKPIN